VDARHFFEIELPARLARAPELLPDGVTIGFDVETAGAWQIVSTETGARVEARDDRPKDCEVHCAPRTLSAMVHSRRAATRAFVSGQIKIVGDVGLLLRLQALLGPQG
jgi:ubiquinone biosynthesis protein UbiJ